MTRLDRWAVATVLSSLPLRSVLAAFTDLSPDEAYYLSAARTGWLPPDHPPLTILLARAADAIPALPLELRLRAVPLVLGTVTALLLLLAVALRDAPAATQRWTAVVSSWTLLPMAGGFLATPDAPAACVVAALLVLYQLPGSPASRVAAFVVAALGLASKVVLIPLVFLSALLPWRANRWRLPMGAALACSALLVGPSLVFQTNHAFRPGSWSALSALGALAAVVAAQLALWSPSTWIDGLRALPRAPLLDRAWALALIGLVVGSTLIRAVPAEPNWLAPAALVLIVSAARGDRTPSTASRVALLAFGPLLTVVAASHVIHPWLPLPASADPAARLHGWKSNTAPTQAPGIGVYAAAAERCVYRNSCHEIDQYFQTINSRSSSDHQGTIPARDPLNE